MRRRVGTARRRGCGHGGQAYARNRRLRLSMTHRGEPGGSGSEATRTRLLHHGGGELPGGSAYGWGGRGDGLRGHPGDVAGAESGASCAARSTSEHGNHPWSARGSRGQRGTPGWAHRQPIGPGWGRAVVVVRGRESRSQGEGRQRSREGMDTAMPKDAPVNARAPPQRPQGRGGGYRRCRPTFTVGHHAIRQGSWRARCAERRTPGSASGLGKRTSSNAGTAPQADSTPWMHDDAASIPPRRPRRISSPSARDVGSAALGLVKPSATRSRVVSVI